MKKSTVFVLILIIMAIVIGNYLIKSPTEETILINIIGENTSNLAAIQKVLQSEQLENGVSIKFHPNTFEDAFNKINSDFANGTGLYDIVMQYNFSLSSFLRNDYVYTLDELLKLVPGADLSFENDLFPNAWKEVGYYYSDPSDPISAVSKVGYPFATNTMLMVYNKEIFGQSSFQNEFRSKFAKTLKPPRSWSEYRQIVEFLTRPKEGYYGVVLEGANGGWLYYEFMNFLFGQDGKTMDKSTGWALVPDSSLTIKTKANQKALEFFLSLKEFSAGDFFSTGQFEKASLLKSGKVALAFVWSDTVMDIIKRPDGTIDSRFGFLPIPGNKSILAGGAFFVSKRSKNPKKAFKLILKLMQPEIQAKLARHGLQSCFMSAYKDYKVKELPYASALQESLKRGVYMLEAGPDADAINNIFTKHIQLAWRGEESVSEALTNIQSEILKERSSLLK